LIETSWRGRSKHDVHMAATINKAALEGLYGRYNRREFVHPDPLEVLYDYDHLADREIAALVASSLAYGRVGQILASVSLVLGRMGAPSLFLERATADSLRGTFADFKHRFTTGEDLSAMLWGVRGIIRRYGSVQGCFLAGLRDDHDTVLAALSSFVAELRSAGRAKCGRLLPSPAKGSACKRLNLFLRWMVRRDAVDPGGWNGVSPSRLIVPLDVHMHRICRALRLTRRRQADMRTAMEITSAFRDIVPDDPVRYDFALTRLGIREDIDLHAFLEQYDPRAAPLDA